jgi:hypothetical protein
MTHILDPVQSFNRHLKKQFVTGYTKTRDENLSLFRDPKASNENLLLAQDMKVRDENLLLSRISKIIVQFSEP